MAPVPGFFDAPYPLVAGHRPSLVVARFCAALAAAAGWAVLSLLLAQPWIAELGAIVGPLPAFLMIAGVAVLPGFMNAFHAASLLLMPRQPEGPDPASYPPITVLVAAYNEAPNIAGALRSIAAQRYPADIEIVLIDDGSTDGTAEAALARGLPAVRLIRHPANLGKSAALNRGLDEARCELVVTVDADSCLHRDALRLLVRHYLRGPARMRAVAGAVFVNDAQPGLAARLQYWDYFHGIAACKRVQSAYGATLVAQGAFSLYQRTALREIGGWPTCMGEDIVATWALIKRGWAVGYAQDALCFTRVPETLGCLGQQRKRWARGMIEALRSHPGVLLKRRLATFLLSWSLMFPVIDVCFTFCFIPGLVLALFGHYWLVGPATLLLVPSALLLGCVMYCSSTRVFEAHGMSVKRDFAALAGYTLGYGFIMHPSSVRGYAAELFGARKSWETK